MTVGYTLQIPFDHSKVVGNSRGACLGLALLWIHFRRQLLGKRWAVTRIKNLTSSQQIARDFQEDYQASLTLMSESPKGTGRTRFYDSNYDSNLKLVAGKIAPKHFPGMQFGAASNRLALESVASVVKVKGQYNVINVVPADNGPGHALSCYFSKGSHFYLFDANVGLYKSDTNNVAALLAMLKVAYGETTPPYQWDHFYVTEVYYPEVVNTNAPDPAAGDFVWDIDSDEDRDSEILC